MTNTIKGFFFDLDGTLVNTHESNYRAYQQAIQEITGKTVGDALKEEIKNGESSSFFLPRLLEGAPDDVIRQIRDRKKQVYSEHLHVSELNEFLSVFLENMSPHHVTALVTTAKEANAKEVLDVHGLADYFDFCIFGDEVTKMKPHPEAYLKALERSGLTPDEVIAFEDSERGVEAAVAAGIQTIKIRTFLDA